MTKKGPLSIGEKLQKQIDKYNKRQAENMRLFRELGGDVDKPIDIMKLLKK